MTSILKTKIGNVHQVILDSLSSGEWVSAKKLLELTNQKYFDRRIRELRDEEGWQIAHNMIGTEHGYILTSTERKIGTKRHYPSIKLKKQIFDRDHNQCQLCGKQLVKGEANIDHKKPLIRNGDIKPENLQTLCVECNVVKRGLCRKCKRDTCDECFLANPSMSERHIILPLSRDAYAYLQKESNNSGRPIQEIIINLIESVQKSM